MDRTPAPGDPLCPPASAAPPLLCWGIHDGAAGHASQVRGLCSAICPEPFSSEGSASSAAAGMPRPERGVTSQWTGNHGGADSYHPAHRIVCCELKPPVSLLTATWKLVGKHPFRNGAEFQWPQPRISISCGRKAAVAGLWLKQQSRGRTILLHLQDPQLSREQFDLVIAPEHDGLRGRNVVATTGALHPLSSEALSQAARSGPVAGLQDLSPGFVTVLLGGPNRCFPFSPEDVSGLISRLSRVAATGRPLAIIPSRRTPPAAVEACRRAFPNQFVWYGHSENPYRSALALGSATIVTSDSVSMISEATATGRPVYVEFLSARRSPAKFLRFHESFLEKGMIRPFVGRIDDWSYPPLFEAERIAALLRERFGDVLAPPAPSSIRHHSAA